MTEIRQSAKKYKDGKEVKDPKATPAPVTGREKNEKFEYPTMDFLHPYVLIETTAQGDRTGPTNRQEAVTLLNASLTGSRILADAMANHPAEIRIIDVKAWRDLGFGL